MTSLREKATLRLHAGVSIDDFRDALKGVFNSHLSYHSAECIFDPLRFDPHLPHFMIQQAEFSPHQPRWEGVVQLSPFPLFFQVNQGVQTIRLSALQPDDGDMFEDNDFFQEIMQPRGWRYACAMGFWERGELQALIVIWRTESDGDFSFEEVATLQDEVYDHFGVALKRVLRCQEENALLLALSKVSADAETSLILLDWQMRVLHSNRSARELCLLWNHGEEGAVFLSSTQAFHLPREIEDACLQLKLDYEKANQELNSCALGEELEVFTSNNEQLSARILRLRLNRSYRGKPLFQVSLQRLCPDEEQFIIMRLPSVLAEQSLSSAEQQVVKCVCQGLSNQEIADRLNKSSDTVKKQLGSVFRKLGVSSRGRLATLCMQLCRESLQ